MISRKRSLSTGAITVDFLLLIASFFMAVLFAQPPERMLQKPLLLILLMVQLLVWYFSTRSNGLYENVGTRLYLVQFSGVFKAAFVQTISAILFIFIVKEDLYTRNFILINSILLVFTISIRTIAFRKIVKYRHKMKINERSLLIIGSGKLASSFYNTVSENPSFGYGIIKLIGNDKCSHEHYLGSLEKLEKVLESGVFFEAIIALDKSQDDEIFQIVNLCNKYAVHTFFIPEYVKFLSNRFEFGLIGDYPILSLRREPLEELHWRFCKRIIDIFIAVITLVFIGSWLFPVIALLQKIFSPGPVLYIQDRVGKNNSVFKCYKFRSMKNAPEFEKFKPVLGNDSRVTKLGSFLRRSNFDELPQVVNVLKGEMSIVGPRPHAVTYNNVYEEFVEELRLRNLVKPGITGWAQINGLRGDVDNSEENRKRIKKRITFDIWYIENWSLFLDFQIIFLTFWQMLSGKTKGH